jgi:methylenetetrahydrofolate reductase (NADPH)
MTSGTSSPHPIHPNWDRPAAHVLDGYSLEMTAKDRPALDEAAHLMAPQTPIAITFLSDEEMDDRIAAAVRIRELGFEPMPHLSARRIRSEEMLKAMMQRLVEEAGAKRVFLVAGDPPVPAGPFSDTLQMIQRGVFELNGISAVGIAGHPEGHPNVDRITLWQWMETKMREITSRGMAPLVVTQFGFDSDVLLKWLVELRSRGIEAPVRIGVPGPAGIKRLLRYAKFCGVGASAAVLKKYGISLANLIGNAGPEKLVDELRLGLGPEHGRVRLHFYPFGGLKATVEWINEYADRNGEALPRHSLT